LFFCSGSNSQNDQELWPEIEPFKTGHLKVSEIHRIYYELCGNPEGRPVFTLHGGPGGSSSPYMRRFFNPEKFLIIQHDQRGSGKSEPLLEIRENTTQDLVEDIERLRKYLDLDKIILFGGSWGSTLAIAYAETYPQNVSGLVLRGIFTATKEEIDYFYHGGVRLFFPEVYEELVGRLPDPEKRPLPQALLEMIQSRDPEIQYEYAKAWTKYEFKISGLNIPESFLRDVDKMNKDTVKCFGLMENYYMANNCFLEEGQLLKNAHRIKDIPTVMVNGRYDMICPPINGYRLHQILPDSRLVIAEGAGHWMGEPPVEKELLKAMRDFE
jgi:proline iminopeptidase